MRRVALGAATAALLCVAGCGEPTFDVDSPFAIVHTAPSHTAVGVAVDVDVQIGFNRAVDRESAAEQIALTVPGVTADEAVVVDHTLLFQDDDAVVSIVPTRTLPEATEVRIAVSGDMKSADNVKLATPFEAFFTTVDATP